MGPGPESLSITQALEVIRKLEEKDIEALEARVIEHRKKVFLTLSDEEKMALASLEKMPTSLINALIKIQAQGIRIIGLHDLSNFIWSLHILTGDERYAMLCLEIRKVRAEKKPSV